ncbi:MAG: pentapeptide repeat-containing protein [Desulfobulbaceae bacterium]|nr:pentapeptide repeat-containing protein [Desulfobulbaceae bacterium]
MRHGVLSFILVVLLLAAPVFSFSQAASPRPEVEENVRQLREKNSCPGCDLAGAILHRGNFTGADLEGANLAGAQLNLANLAGANLRDANLQGASFGGADLAGADLTGANLTGAVIEGAYLVGAKMDGRVVVRRPYAEEGGPGSGETVFKEAEGNSKNLPFTNQATVTGQKAAQEKASAPEETEPAKTSTGLVPDEGERQARVMSKDTVPKKSKQLKAMDEARVVARNPPREPLAPAGDEAAMEAVADNPPVVIAEKEKIAASAAEPGEMAAKAAATEQAVAEPMVEMVQAAEKAVAEPAADPDAEKKKILVKKLLDDNRCVACDLSGVDLSDRDLEDADLERANLKGANLRETDLEGANLKGADLRGADLRHADFREADLYRADVSGADLTGAKLKGALIDSLIRSDAVGADFTGAVGSE